MRKKLKELHQKDTDELKALLGQKRRESAKTRFDLKLKKVKNVHKIKSIRKEIARALTIIRERELMEKSKTQ